MALIASKYDTEIDIKFGELSPMISWCQHYCTGDWRYQIMLDAGETAGHYRFNFENETDLVNFILWKK